MNGHALFVWTIRALAVASLLLPFRSGAAVLEETVTRTNLVDRWITNVIEVSMPRNRFVDVYRTNWVTEFRTNVVDLYSTNLLTQTVTNQVIVDAFRTNFVTAYQTNWQTLDLTNWQTAIVMQTNRLSRTLTNRVLVEAFETNFVAAYQTNLRTLDLTNWQTVIVIKTNWVTQAATNLVQVDVASPPAASEPVRESEEPKVEAGASASAVAPSGPLVIEAARTARPPRNGQMEVQLKVRGNGGSAAAFQVQQWKVERQDRAILCFGQEPAFTRELPAGKYKVEVRVRLNADGAVVATRGTMVVTPGEAHIEQTLAAGK